MAVSFPSGTIAPLVEGKTPPFSKPLPAGTPAPTAPRYGQKRRDSRALERPHPYNTNGQVTRETFPDGTSYTYTYDAHGNLLTATDPTGTTTFTYNAADEL